MPPDPEAFDPIAEAQRQWASRWPDQADRMAAVTSVMRVHQLLLNRIEEILRPCGLTFPAYEALQLLAFTRAGSLPMGKIGKRLMVHAASVTNVIDRLEQRGLVERSSCPVDRRVVLAGITGPGRALADQAAALLNGADFGLPDVSRPDAAEVTARLRALRVSAGDDLAQGS